MPKGITPRDLRGTKHGRVDDLDMTIIREGLSKLLRGHHKPIPPELSPPRRLRILQLLRLLGDKDTLAEVKAVLRRK